MSQCSPKNVGPEIIALQRQLQLASYAQDALHDENERLRVRYEELQQVLAGIEQAKERREKRENEDGIWEGKWKKLKRGLQEVRDSEARKVPSRSTHDISFSSTENAAAPYSDKHPIRPSSKKQRRRVVSPSDSEDEGAMKVLRATLQRILFEGQSGTKSAVNALMYNCAQRTTPGF
ncbi:hypothetical protein, variant, partial [Cryptococcus amylolentus CBS 6039]